MAGNLGVRQGGLSTRHGPSDAESTNRIGSTETPA
jgi:hypothetical protein